MEMNNGVVISGAVALVGLALLLVLGVLWFDRVRQEQIAPAGHDTEPASCAPSGCAARQSALHLAVGAPIPDLRVYAVQRATRKVKHLPTLSQPQIVSWLLAAANESDRLADPPHATSDRTSAHQWAARPAPITCAPVAFHSGQQPSPANRHADRHSERHQPGIVVASAGADNPSCPGHFPLLAHTTLSQLPVTCPSEARA